MSRKKSTEYFHILPENLNCAQSILKGFQNEFKISDEEIEVFRAWGGGRAKDGVCGALFAAERLLKRVNKQSIIDEFVLIVGNSSCMEIKNSNFSCLKCIELADDLIDKRLK